MSPPIVDHAGKPVEHGRAKVNGVRLHYIKAGQGEPLFLLHGVPKTHYHWRHVIPLLTKHFTVIAPDLRGLGDSEHPVLESCVDIRGERLSAEKLELVMPPQDGAYLKDRFRKALLGRS